MILKRIVRTVVVALVCIGAVPGRSRAQEPTAPPAQTSQQPQQQNEFIPLDQLPPTEQLPAPRLLIAAYMFVLGALFVYIVSLSKRLGHVRREVERLEADLKRSGRT
jgi:CcmD family protein